jgi:outer membrane receptor for ferrienterochelin and colicins
VGNLKNTKNWARMGLAMGGAIGGMVGTTGSTAAYGAEMTPDMTGGTQIVVTASTRAQSVKDAPASISVITREDIERLPYREVTDALMEIPGVTVTTGEGNSRDISIRDMAPQYTLILVDGRRLSARNRAPTGAAFPRVACCRRWRRSSGSRSCAGRCPRSMARMRWAAWSMC